MMIRREKAEFLDKLLKLFNEVRVIRKKDLEEKCRGNTYLLVQTEKHLKILEKDGMISYNVLDEYNLQPQGRTVLNNLDKLGYVAKHRIEEAEWEEYEDDDHADHDDEIFLQLHLLFA